MRFPSPEWTLELCRQINGSAAYAAAARKWEGDLTLVVEHEGGIYLDLWHGECRGAEFLEDATARPSAFRITGSRDRWLDVLHGETDPIQALVKRQLILDGNLVQIMKHVKAAQELVKCAASVPVNE
jgi:putative sterol carrier protein